MKDSRCADRQVLPQKRMRTFVYLSSAKRAPLYGPNSRSRSRSVECSLSSSAYRGSRSTGDSGRRFAPGQPRSRGRNDRTFVTTMVPGELDVVLGEAGR